MASVVNSATSCSLPSGTRSRALILVLSGPGGVGKGTVARRLIEVDDRFWLSRSWTTRARRPGEAPDAYHFVSRSEFETRVAEGGFLEWAEFLGHLYGTPVPGDEVTGDLLLEIDIQGAAQVREKHPESLVIFLEAPPGAQEARLAQRGDPESTRRERVAEAERERGAAAELGASVVVNDDVDRAVAEIRALAAEHRVRTGEEH